MNPANRWEGPATLHCVLPSAGCVRVVNPPLGLLRSVSAFILHVPSLTIKKMCSVPLDLTFEGLPGFHMHISMYGLHLMSTSPETQLQPSPRVLHTQPAVVQSDTSDTLICNAEYSKIQTADDPSFPVSLNPIMPLRVVHTLSVQL